MNNIVTVSFFAVAIPFTLVHFTAESLRLYDRQEWIDLPMHFFGGLLIAVALFAIVENGIWLPIHSMAFVVGTVVAAAVGWEIFEVLAKIIDFDAYLRDTTVDLILGTSGGCVGFWLGRRLHAV